MPATKNKPRPYQKNALVAMADQFIKKRTTDAGIVILPTGAGKTFIGSYFNTELIKQLALKIIWVAHRDELINQAIEAHVRAEPDLKYTTWMANKKDASGDIIFTSIQSTRGLAETLEAMYGNNNSKFVLAYDECHHFAAPDESTGYSNMYADLFMALKNSGMLFFCYGLTATAERLDGKPLGFKNVVYQMKFTDGVREGFLARPKLYEMRTQQQFHLDTAEKANGKRDYTDADLRQLDNPVRNKKIAQEYVRHAVWRTDAEGNPKVNDAGEKIHGWGKTLIFAVNVAHCYHMAEELKLLDPSLDVRVVTGGTNNVERHEFKEWLAAGDKHTPKVAVNCLVFCLDAETEILTRSGWVGPDEITEDHLVANWKNGEVSFEAPKEIIDRLTKEDEYFYGIDTSRRNIRVTGKHRILYRYNAGENWRKAPVEDLVGKRVQLPLNGRAIPDDSIIVKQRNKHLSKVQYDRAIQANSFVLRKQGMSFEESVVVAKDRLDRRLSLRDLNPFELSIDQCRFIGYWLGDGCRSKLQSGGTEYTLIQSTNQPAIVDWVDRLIERCGFDSIKRTKNNSRLKNPVVVWSLPRGTGFGCQERVGLYPIEQYLVKDGTDLFWGLNEEQFSALIEGFWYADGNHGQAIDGVPESFYISNTNVKVLDLLQSIAVVRGWSSTLRPTKIRKVGHNVLWNLSFRRRDHYCVGGDLSRNGFLKEGARKQERAWCVKTTSKNIITRRNGFVTVMGNTEGFDEPSINTIFLTRPTKSESLWMQMVGRGARIIRDPVSGELTKTEFNLVSVMDEIGRYGALVKDWSLGLMNEHHPKATKVKKQRKAKIRAKRKLISQLLESEGSKDVTLSEAELVDVQAILICSTKFSNTEGIPLDRDRIDCLRLLKDYLETCFVEEMQTDGSLAVNLDMDAFRNSYSHCVPANEFDHDIWRRVAWAYYFHYVRRQKYIRHNITGKMQPTWKLVPMVAREDIDSPEAVVAAEQRIASVQENSSKKNEEFNLKYGGRTGAKKLYEYVLDNLAKQGMSAETLFVTENAVRILAQDRRLEIKLKYKITDDADKNIKLMSVLNKKGTEVLQLYLQDSVAEFRLTPAST